MVIKKLILLFVVLSVLVFGYLNWWGGDQEQEEAVRDSGGSGGGTPEGTQLPVEVQTPEETITSEEMETLVETETFEEAETPQETEAAEEERTPGETLTPGTGDGIEEEQTEYMTGEEGEAGIIQPAENESQTYLVRLKNYLFIPSELEVNVGDSVVWRNFDESGVFTLSSKEGLFEDERLGYGNTLNYTFTENGSYSFSANGYPNMQMTITVK
ncbi:MULTISPECIES: cell surface lipoprotein [unclassified Methanosarcina]|uniref:cell surface lipoprotein n=1 Tax=unclassified Methanosarcina TaxID=2644672 RepID=UPI0006160AC0|nr:MULTISPECIES: cell surface lipoprotein [unclassified Methanosarcina]AKB20067.1 Cell surface lipoprotein [Methanosarcina sp. WWM596]AKB21637.1 Cell surface lipoprotein [Methanosarcina sp. WH1]